MDDRIKIKRLSHVTFAHLEVDYTRQFLLDFGLTEVSVVGNKHYFRGYGDLPYVYVLEAITEGQAAFRAAAFEVESHDELDKASKLQHATPIRALDSPGKGYYVDVRDPNGMIVRLVWGQELVVPNLPTDPTLPINKGLPQDEQKARPVGVFQRFQASEPPPIHKLGHFVIYVPKFQSTYDFYTRTFTLSASDILVNPDGKEIGSFLHLDRGDEWVDHHTLFLYELPGLEQARFHHAAFEVFDVDHQLRAHAELLAKGYELSWGVGRHILGSQLFDYWYQSGDGFKVEHYADGDVVNSSTPVGRHTIDPKNKTERDTSVWGPSFGPTFHHTSPIAV